jgi:hypothetical protein
VKEVRTGFGSEREKVRMKEDAMNSASRVILATILMLIGVAPRAHAETDQYCFDYVRSVQAQLQRATAAKCDVQQSGWSTFWSSDMKEHFGFCHDSDAGTIEYVKNQRESQLSLCESKPVGPQYGWAVTAKDFRITGGPGDYTIYWTIENLNALENDFAQVRLETPPGRTGGYHHEMGEGRGAFTYPLVDRYPGQPGDVVRLKWHGCARDVGAKLMPSKCDPWKQLVLVMPPAIPEFRPARIVALDPAEFTPTRFMSSKGRMKLATQGATEALKLRLDGTNVSFTPAPFQYPNGSWDPEVKVHLLHGQQELYTSPVLRFPANGVQRVDVPLSVLDAVQCGPSVGATGHCATLDVEVESFKRWTSGDIKGHRDLLGKSRTQLRLVTPMAEKTAMHQVQATAPRMPAAGLNEPAQIVSACGTTYRIGSVGFGARQSNVESSTASHVPVELQYAAGQGLWGSSTLLTTLPAVANSKPPEYRASLAIGQLAKTASSWRWRVRAVYGARTSEWCSFTVAAAPAAGGGQKMMIKSR